MSNPTWHNCSSPGRSRNAMVDGKETSGGGAPTHNRSHHVGPMQVLKNKGVLFLGPHIDIFSFSHSKCAFEISKKCKYHLPGDEKLVTFLYALLVVSSRSLIYPSEKRSRSQNCWWYFWELLARKIGWSEPQTARDGTSPFQVIRAATWWPSPQYRTLGKLIN